MAALSLEHRDGWGIAVFDAREEDWKLNRGIACASEDARFHEIAMGSRGELMISHIRKRTVGPTSLENTHPFHAGRWVFAHNGTISDCDFVRANTSPERLAARRGETDSELFFAYLLTQLDRRGLTNVPAGYETDVVIRDATAAARARPNFGAFNYLLSDGSVLYANRWGRTLFLLSRSPHDEVVLSRRSRDGTIVETPWSQKRHAILIASEELTAEPWQPLEEGILLRIQRTPLPDWRLLAA